MPDKTIIAASLQLDASSANKSLKDFNSGANDAKKGLGELSDTVSKTGETVKTSSGHFSKLKETMSSLPGPIGQASEGVKGLGSAFKALLANPVSLAIIAIVAALALLYKAFTNTFEGGQKMEQVFAGIKAAGQALLDNITKIAGAIVKLFTFDFSGAINDIKGVAKAAGDAYSAMAKLTAQAQQLHKEELGNDLDQAERAKKLAILREQATEDVDPKKRLDALKELRAAAEQNSKDDIDLAKRTTENKIAQLTLEKDGAQKNQDEINELKIKQINVETDNANELRRIGKQVTAAEKQEDAEKAAIHKEQIARIKELTEKQKEAEKERLAQIDREVAAAYKKMDADLKIAGERIKNQEEENAKAAADALIKAGTGREIDPNLIRANNAVLANQIIQSDQEFHSEKMKEITQDEAEARAESYNLVTDALGNLSTIFGKQSAVGKAIAVAAATISTIQGAVNAFTSLSPIPIVGPALGAIAAAAAVASGVANVKKILAVQIPGASGGGGSAPSISVPTAPLAPKNTATTLDQTSLNGIGNAATASRVYVLDSDIQNSQERDTRLNRAARLG